MWVREDHPLAERFPGKYNQNVYFYQLKQKGSFKLLPKEKWWEDMEIPHLQRKAPNDVDDYRPVK